MSLKDLAERTMPTTIDKAKNNESIEIISSLLKYRAIINRQSLKWHLTPLPKVIQEQNKLLAILLVRGTKVHLGTSQYFNTPLHIAVLYKCPKIVSLLLSYQVDINAKNEFDQTPLIVCLQQKEVSFAIVKLLVENGADVNTRDKFNRTPALCAVKYEDVRILNILIQYGATVNTAVLAVAIKHNRIESASLLVKCGIDVNRYVFALLNNGIIKFRSLLLAVLSKNVEMTLFLLKNNAKVNFLVSKRRNLLHTAAMSTSLDIFKLLIKYGADINELSSKQYSVVHYAAQNEDGSILRFLVESGFSVNKKNEYVRSPLCVAAWKLKKENFIFLANSGAFFNYKVDMNLLTKLSMIDLTDKHAWEVNKLIHEHVIRMNYLHTSVSIDALHFQHEMSMKLAKECHEEVHCMMNEIISSYRSVTLFDFISRDWYNQSLLRNEVILKVINKNAAIYREKYPNYYDILSTKIGKFTKEALLLKESHKIISGILGEYINLPAMCIFNILSSFSEKDMKLLIKENYLPRKNGKRIRVGNYLDETCLLADVWSKVVSAFEQTFSLMWGFV